MNPDTTLFWYRFSEADVKVRCIDFLDWYLGVQMQVESGLE